MFTLYCLPGNDSMHDTVMNLARERKYTGKLPFTYKKGAGLAPMRELFAHNSAPSGSYFCSTWESCSLL